MALHRNFVSLNAQIAISIKGSASQHFVSERLSQQKKQPTIKPQNQEAKIYWTMDKQGKLIYNLNLVESFQSFTRNYHRNVNVNFFNWILILLIELCLFFYFVISGNKTNQCNPSHTPSGPGRSANYQGSGTKPDLNNHANQMNSNNPSYRSSRK